MNIKPEMKPEMKVLREVNASFREAAERARARHKMSVASSFAGVVRACLRLRRDTEAKLLEMLSDQDTARLCLEELVQSGALVLKRGRYDFGPNAEDPAAWGEDEWARR
ncbi:MAG: hypothetical protein WKG00_18175 [Polyangiaceae bacterium]